jgi:hypothetical protein
MAAGDDTSVGSPYMTEFSGVPAYTPILEGNYFYCSGLLNFTLPIFYQGIERLSLICQAGNLPARGKPKKNETSPGNFMLHLLRKSS